MAEPRWKSEHALLHNVRAVQVSLAGIKKNINFSGKNFVKGKVVACLLHDFVEVR